MSKTPSAAKLIHLLIEERAKVIRYHRRFETMPPGDRDRDQARREIEAEVLRQGARS